MCSYRRFECLHCFRVFIQVDSEHGDSMLRPTSDKYVTICGRHEPEMHVGLRMKYLLLPSLS